MNRGVRAGMIDQRGWNGMGTDPASLTQIQMTVSGRTVEDVEELLKRDPPKVCWEQLQADGFDRLGARRECVCRSSRGGGWGSMDQTVRGGVRRGRRSRGVMPGGVGEEMP